MGSTNWSDKEYMLRASSRRDRGEATFAYHNATASRSREERTAHKTLDPQGMKLREARDSDVHPESLAIATIFDVTGSMARVPRVLQEKLPKLMALLISKGYVQHPAILTGGVGDATCDTVPLQLGQFESGIEIENDLTNLFLEGGGGGSREESYELALYFLARHTACDCFEKRGKRGYAFLIGDEKPYGKVRKDHVQKIFGETLQADIPIEEIVAEAQQKFDVYMIRPAGTSHYAATDIHEAWTSLLGQNVLRLEQPDAVCELIAATIGAAEGYDVDAIGEDLKAAGTDLATVDAVKGALASRKATGGEISIPDSGAASGVATL